MEHYIIYYTATIQLKEQQKQESGMIGIISDTDALLREKATSHVAAIYRREFEGCDDVQIDCTEVSKVPEAQYRELSFRFKT